MVNNELSVAPRCAAQMLARDKAVQDLGIKVTVTGAGEASAVLEIAERMQNGHGVCHGGADIYAGRYGIRICLQWLRPTDTGSRRID